MEEEKNQGPIDPVERIRRNYQPFEGGVNAVSSAEALLRAPGRILFELRNGNGRTVGHAVLAAALFCLAAYGLTVGMFSWGDQVWSAPLKISLGALFSALICFPSLVIFSFLAGSDSSIGEIFVLLLATLALSSLLLLGFGPVSWVFTQSTESAAFMGALHIVFWLVGVYYGIRFLGAATGFLDGDRGRHIAAWSFIFLLVTLQMMTTLRPLVGSSEVLLQKEKKFFLTHWAETIDGSASRRGR